MSTVPFPVLNETDDFIVIHKMGGIGMHNTAQHDEKNSSEIIPTRENISQTTNDHVLDKGVVTLVREQLGDDQLFPVHRLDADTSGLLLLAKGKKATSELSQLFATRQVQKYYWAISSSKPSKKQGAIIGDMAKSRGGSWKLVRSKERPSITQFFSFGLEQGKRVFIVKPYTGKTHQIRVVLKSLGAPILGDKRYGGASADRMYLHASHLYFKYKNTEYAFSCMPDAGEQFLSSVFCQRYEENSSPDTMLWPALPSHLADNHLISRHLASTSA